MDTPIELKFDMRGSVRQGDHAFIYQGLGIATAMRRGRRTRSHQRIREGSSMGQKTVRFSDLSGQLIMHDDALARIVVHEHPELGDGPVEIEALTEEAEVMEQAALRVAVVDLYLPDDIEPRRIVMEADAFDKLATQNPMDELLTAARPARRSTRSSANGSSRGDRLDYATREHAGKPHKGKITDTERQLVRDHLDEINGRLAAQGLRTISLTDSEHVERYGLQQLARERNVELGFELGDAEETKGRAGARAKATLEDEISFEDEIGFEDEMAAEDDIAAEVA
jgi:hypothetical protein